VSPAFRNDDKSLNWRTVGYWARSVFAVLLSLTVLVGGGWFVYSKAHDAYIAWRTTDDYIGEGTDPVEVLIPKGASITQIGDILTEDGVVRSTKAFRQAAQDSGQADKLQAGRYELKKELPAETAFAMLLDSDNLVRLKVTFPEGTTDAEQFEIISSKLDVELETVQKAAKQTDKLTSLPKFADGDLEGYLFPSTYEVAEPVKPLSIFASQITQFNKIAEKLSLEGRAEDLGYSPDEVVTVASIIASEVSNVEDQANVAAVIYNRLDADMPLQMDSTVHYAVGKSGKVTTTAEDRKSDSPYNTYVHKGLPPGPISNPGETALEAALHPADVDYKYFVTVNLETGETKFADTLDEHNANVAEFQQWCQANADKGPC